jgi:hypothetical protein
MWELITGYWHWGVVLMMLRTLPRLIWRIATAVPLLKWSEDKIEEMRELDQIKQAQIDSLSAEITRLKGQTGSTGSSSGSPASTPISETTPTSSPAGPLLTASMNLPKPLQRFRPFGDHPGRNG